MRRLLIITILISFVFVSCNEMGTSVFSVNQEEVTSTASGSMVVYIDKDGAPFNFSGNLKLVDGMCHVLLESPVKDTTFVIDTTYKLDLVQLPDSVYIIDSIYISIDQLIRDTIYERTFNAPANINFDEPFERIIGEWLFSYEILPYDGVNPYGNYEFTFSYDD